MDRVWARKPIASLRVHRRNSKEVPEGLGARLGLALPVKLLLLNRRVAATFGAEDCRCVGLIRRNKELVTLWVAKELYNCPRELMAAHRIRV